VFPGNQIPANRFDPVALAVMKLYPQPVAARRVNNFFYSPVAENGTDQVDTRIDHNITQNHRLSDATAGAAPTASIRALPLPPMAAGGPPNRSSATAAWRI
jgi:hypothetical protein